MSQKNILLDANSNELELIEFYIDEVQSDGSSYRGYYGMNVAKVIEIIRQPEVTGMPSKHHAAALGTFNLRGRVLPLVDLAVWLGKEMVRNDALKVIVSEYSGVVTAFLVSGVTRIHRMGWSQVEPPGKHVQNYSGQSVTGVVRIDDRILFILDMEQLIATMNPNLDMNLMVDRMEQDQDGVRVEDADQFRRFAGHSHHYHPYSGTGGLPGDQSFQRQGGMGYSGRPASPEQRHGRPAAQPAGRGDFRYRNAGNGRPCPDPKD